MPVPESATAFLAGLIDRARRSRKKIVFPEGADPRVVGAASKLAEQGILQPILIARRPDSAPTGVTFIDPENSPAALKYAALYYERRRAKGITQVEAAAVARTPLYFAAPVVAPGGADGSAGGGGRPPRRTARAGPGGGWGTGGRWGAKLRRGRSEGARVDGRGTRQYADLSQSRFREYRIQAGRALGRCGGDRPVFAGAGQAG